MAEEDINLNPPVYCPVDDDGSTLSEDTLNHLDEGKGEEE